jgi:hypothetical protein
LPEIALGILVLVGIKICSSGGDKPRASNAATAVEAVAKADPPAAAPVAVPIATLLSEYKQNEVRADQQFKGQIISTTGKVGVVKKDIMNSIYVTVGTGAVFEIPEVQCFPSDGQENKAAALSKGDTVAISGRVEGLMMNVLVKDCQIASPK